MLPNSCSEGQVATAEIHTIGHTEKNVVKLRRTRDAEMDHPGIVEAGQANVQCTSSSSIAVLILIVLRAGVHAC